MVANPRTILGDGTILEETECGYSKMGLWCFVKNLDIIQTFALFSDLAKTRIVRFQYGDTEEIYTGYTDIDLIRRNTDTTDVRLTGEHVSHETRIIDEPQEKEES